MGRGLCLRIDPYRKIVPEDQSLAKDFSGLRRLGSYRTCVIHDGSWPHTRCIVKSIEYPVVAKRWTHCFGEEQWAPPRAGARDREVPETVPRGTERRARPLYRTSCEPAAYLGAPLFIVAAGEIPSTVKARRSRGTRCSQAATGRTVVAVETLTNNAS